MPEKIIRKPFVNKRTKQLSVTIPKKQIPVTLKYAPDLFVEIRFFRMKRKKGGEVK